MQRFTDRELTYLVAYEQLYGPIGPRRLDILFARLGMDVVAPHLKKGKRTKIEDHIVQWGGKPKQTPEQMLAMARQMQKQFERRAKPKNQPKGARGGAAGNPARAAGRGRRRPRPGSTPDRGRSGTRPD